MRHLHHTLVKHTESDTSWKMWQQWGKGRDRGPGLQHPAGSQLCPGQRLVPHGWWTLWSQNWHSRKLALQGGTNWNWVWWTSNAFLSCWHLKLACPLAWRQLEPWWNPLLMDIHSLQNARGLGTGTPGCFNDLLAVGQNSQLRVSRAPVTPPQQQQHWHSGPYGHGQADFPSFWNGWAVSTRSLPSGVSFSTAAENIYRQDKEQTTRLMTLQYSFRQGTLWYHNQLILLWHQVFST